VPDLSGRAIVVTGAARGIGAALARGLAAAGARVALADRDLDGVRQVAAGIGGSAIALSVDVTDRNQVRAMVATTVAVFGRLDVIFNNAGIVETREFLELSEEDWRRMLDVNGLGCLSGMQEAARQMIAQRWRRQIVNTASIAGRQGSRRWPTTAPASSPSSRSPSPARRPWRRTASRSTPSAPASSRRRCGTSSTRATRTRA
jgi:meso-butanediol dehydrogenase/(S,S)-butanediol dehydrogenase/diacetyl reductase